MTQVLLVGVGNMAKEYAKVLKELNIAFDVIGRGKDSAESFQREFEIPVKQGGLDKAFSSLKIPTHAIVATTLESLEENTIFLLNNGVKNILVEKPGALTKEGILRIANIAETNDANVYIAYNRRFYASILEAKRRVEQDGGLSSIIFEFTEWSHVIKDLNKTTFQLNNWFIGNSTHVIDTAFFFGGIPKQISAYVAGSLDWHPTGSVYAGAGITENDILFSYHANWSAPGSWKLELLTNQNRYIFRPFEKLSVQKLGTVLIEEIELNDTKDKEFKPGIFEQTNSFLNMNALSSNLLRVNESYERYAIYEKMRG